jgi:hypothetical protein
MSGIALIIKKNIAYAIGPRADWMHENKWVTTVVCVVLMVSVIAASRRGLALGKWVQNFGGALLLFTFATLILLPSFLLPAAVRWRTITCCQPASQSSTPTTSTCAANLR